MLSISKPFKGAGRADYYLNLAQEDYYLGGREPPGFWLGEAATAMNLPEVVIPDHFRYLLRGFNADGSGRLVHNAGSDNRRSGWDLTWSVPKSVSVAWSQATPETRLAIETAVREAVRRAIAYLEGVGVVSRRGTDGVVHERAKLLFAAFEHSTSRAQDPQLHIHTLLINMGVRADGSTGTLDPRALYRHQMAAGALFRAELAARLERALGLRACRVERCFEILGVEPALIAEFSKRRAQIEARLREMGIYTAAAAETAALDTRTVKEMPPREELFSRWQEVGRAFHWSTKELSWLLHAPFLPRDHECSLRAASEAGLSALTHHDSHFSARQLVQTLAEEAQGRGMDADAVLQLQSQLLASPKVVPLQSVLSEPRWTTPEMLALETHSLQVAETMHGIERTVGKSDWMAAQFRFRYPNLAEEQRNALRHVTESTSGIRVVSGMAGTGKSTLFQAAREVWSEQGRQVIGACLSGKAALELSKATQIPSKTIHGTIIELNQKRLRLNPDTVLLIDEAAMVGTRQMKIILDCCHAASATLVLCGDARQLQAIEAGGLFLEFSERYGAATLQQIKRQREPWAQEAVKAFADGRTTEALQEYDGRGLVSLSDEPHMAMKQLLADWKESALGTPDAALILASRNADVLEMNRLAQIERMRAGYLTGSGVAFSSCHVFANDRVVFTRNCPTLGVMNGQTATVESSRNHELVVRLDSGSRVSFSPGNYPHLQLAYALTTHKAQGMTVEQAFVYVDETAINREAAYVQASRARGLCSFYGVGDDLNALEPGMNRSRPKVLATSLLAEPAEGPALTLALAY